MMKNQFLLYRQMVTQALEGYRAVRRQNNVTDKGLSVSVERKAAPFVKGHFTFSNCWKNERRKVYIHQCFPWEQ